MATNATSESAPWPQAGRRLPKAIVRARWARRLADHRPSSSALPPFFGGGIAFTFQNMPVTGQPLWTFGFTSYAWRRSWPSPQPPRCTGS